MDSFDDTLKFNVISFEDVMLYGKIRPIIIYEVIKHDGEIIGESKMSLDRKWIRPAYSDMDYAKWVKLSFCEQDQRYFFDADGRRFFLCLELIRFLDDVLVDQLLSGDLKLD